MKGAAVSVTKATPEEMAEQTIDLVGKHGRYVLRFSGVEIVGIVNEERAKLAQSDLRRAKNSWYSWPTWSRR
jgi:hypothetical protein